MTRNFLEVRQQVGGIGQIVDAEKSIGNIFFVDSGAAGAGATSGYGKDWDSPFNSLANMIAAAVLTANQGDIVYVAQGHAETVTNATALALATAGVKIIGLGEGAARPTITFATNNTASIVLGAASCVIENLILVCAKDGQTAMVDINAADCKVKGCEFRADGTYQPVTMVDVNGGAANACDGTKILHNTLVSITAGASRGIELGEVADRVVIDGNRIYGDWSDAGIHNPTGKIITDLTIDRNSVANLQTGDHAIELVSACTGVANDNRLYGDTLGTIFDSGSLFCNGNLETDAIDQSGVPSPLAAAGPLPAGSIDAAAIADNAIDAGAIAGDAITNSKIADNALSEEQFDGDAATKLSVGIPVTTGIITLPQGVAKRIFTVAGGLCLVKALIARVTTGIQDQANNTKFTGNPTTGNDVDLCTVVGSSGLEVGGFLSVDGVPGNALLKTNAGQASACSRPFIVNTGKIDLSCSASNSGAVAVTIVYVPLTSGATIVQGTTT